MMAPISARGLVALAVDDEHVAGLRDRHRGVDHQVVAGAHLDGQRRAGELHASAQRPRCGRCSAPRRPCTSARIDGLELRRLAHEVGGDALEVADRRRAVQWLDSSESPRGLAVGNAGASPGRRWAPAPGSVDLGARFLDDLAPAGDVVAGSAWRTARACRQRGRRLRRRGASCSSGSFSALLNVGVQLGDHVLRQWRPAEQAEPGDGLEALVAGLGDGRHLRQVVDALGGGHGERAHLAAAGCGRAAVGTDDT